MKIQELHKVLEEESSKLREAKDFIKSMTDKVS